MPPFRQPAKQGIASGAPLVIQPAGRMHDDWSQCNDQLAMDCVRSVYCDQSNGRPRQQLLVVAPIAFMIGRWMGRALTPSVPAAQGAGNVVAAHMVMPMFLVLVLARIENPVFDASQFLVSTLLLILLLFVSLCGYRRGRKQVLGVYMAYLLDRASRDAQQEILKRAYDEAVAYQGAGGRQPRITTIFSG